MHALSSHPRLVRKSGLNAHAAPARGPYSLLENLLRMANLGRQGVASEVHAVGGVQQEEAAPSVPSAPSAPSAHSVGGGGGRPPEHLLVLVNGLFGSRANWEVMQGLIEAQLGSGALLHASQSNEFAQTFQGIDVCGERLASEIRELRGAHPSLQSISVVAHSMGGLLSRYAIGRLYDPGTQTVAGLKPRHFVAIATPHLGCDVERSPAQVPFIGWIGALPSVGLRAQSLLGTWAAPVSSFAFAKTGRQFFLADAVRGEAPPLLARMTADEPEEGLLFMSGLAAFATRTLYANSSGDHLVSWGNASLRSLLQLPTRSAKGRGVVREDPIEAAWHPPERPYQHSEDQAAAAAGESSSSLFSPDDRVPPDATSEHALAQAASGVTGGTEQRGQYATAARRQLMGRMLHRLQALPFRRVDVCFGATLLPIMAHQNIQVQRRWLNREGMPVARHVAEQLAAMESLLGTPSSVKHAS